MALELGIGVVLLAAAIVAIRQTRSLRAELRVALRSVQQERSETRSESAVAGFTADPESALAVSVLDSLETEICFLDADGRVLKTNRAWDASVAGVQISRSTTRGSDFLEFCLRSGYYPAEEGARLAAEVESIVSGVKGPFRGELLANGRGDIRDIAVQVLPLSSGPGGAVVVQSDRTDEHQRELNFEHARRQAETLAGALETSQHSLQFAMRCANLGQWHWDIKTGYFELSHAWLETLGHDQVDLGADIQKFRELLHPDDQAVWKEEDTRLLGHDEPYDRHFRLRRADGSYVWAQALGRAEAWRADGAPECLSGVLLDIDSRKSAELRDLSMARIIEESLNEVYVVDASTYRFLEVNRGARENLGYSLEEMRAMSFWDIQPDCDERRLRDLVSPSRDAGSEKFEYEALHERRDGTCYPVLVNLQASDLMGRPVFVAIVLDVTQRNELESQLRQAQKLESIGELAAGVAHEINTPMQYVGNNIRFLSDCAEQLFEVIEAYENALRDSSSDASAIDRVQKVVRRTKFDRIRGELPNAIDDCVDGIDRVLKIVRAMKELTHPGDDAMVPTDINHLLSSSGTITQNRWKYVADLEYDLDPDAPVVLCDPGTLSQVFINLIVNATDAIDDAEARGAGEGKIVVRSRCDGDWLVVEFRDNGCGMSEATCRRACDPFFTTKEVGRGTGQGLALCHTIIAKKHGGELSIDSALGVGTTICLRLPIAGGPEATSLEEARCEEPISSLV